MLDDQAYTYKKDPLVELVAENATDDVKDLEGEGKRYVQIKMAAIPYLVSL